MTFVIEIDHLEPKVLADELVEISDRLPADLRRRHESAHAQIHQHAAFDDLRDRGFNHFIALVRLDDFFPRLQRACPALRQEQRPVHLVDAMDHDLERIADFQKFRVDGEREFAERKDAFGFSADVDENFVLVFWTMVPVKTWPSSRTFSDSS